MAKIVTPTARLSEQKRPSLLPANWGIISWWCTIGPAINCGKKVTNRKYFSRSYSRASPRAVSTRKAICWKVKKEIASGRMICNGAQSSPAAALMLTMKKSVYLK